MKAFRGYRLDTVNHCLWRGDERLLLAPKAFDVLRYLVEHSERLVTQEEILEALWPDTYVNPEVVKKYVLGIRKVLGDDSAKPEFVATFPRRGYQFIAPIREDNAPNELIASDGPRKNIVGRDEALARLAHALRAAYGGRRQILFVTGEAGIGKTTLLDTFQQSAAATSKLRFARGQCVEGFGGKEAYYPVLDALGQLLYGPDDDAILQILGKRAPTWLVQFPHLVNAEQRDALETQIVGASRERMVREICEALEAVTERNPLVLCLEDLHWVDPSTLDFISAVARRRGPAKLLLIATYRPADVIVSQSPLKALKQDLVVHDLANEISLERLEEDDVARYIELQFERATFPEGFSSLIYEQSGGNALFMVAILQDLAKKGFIAKADRGWLLQGQLRDIARNVPETLDELIEVQFQQLSPTEQQVLRAASVAGEHFSTWAIHNAAELDAAVIESVCEGLVERQQFVKFAGIHELANGQISPHYDFLHSFYREVLYRRLSEVTRSKLHLLLATRLKAFCDPCEQELATELALHFEGGRDYEQAIHYLILAANNATRRFSYRDSIEILEQARGLVPRVDPSRRDELDARILVCIGDASFALGALDDSAQAYHTAAARAGHSGFKSAQVHALVRALYPLGAMEPERGLSAMREAVRMSESIGDARLAAHTQMMSNACHLVFEDWRQSDADAYASAINTLHAFGDISFEPLLQVAHGHVLFLLGKYAEASEAFDACLSRVEDPSTNLLSAFGALSGRTFIMLRIGKAGELLRVTRAGRESPEENRTTWWQLSIREAWLRLEMFDYAGAIQICEPLCRRDDNSVQMPRAICEMAEGYMALHQKDFSGALSHFSNVYQLDRAIKFFVSWLWRMTAHLEIGRVWLQSGEIQRAKSASESALQSALSVADPHVQVLAWEFAARVAAAENDMTLAYERIESAVRLTEKYEIPLAAWQAHATASEIYRARREDDRADRSRQIAQATIMRIADSFEPDEPLRTHFLTAEPVRRVCGKTLKARVSR